MNNNPKHRWQKGNVPWNKGLKGDPRNGWTPERRKAMSEFMREKYKDMGPRYDRREYPDPVVRAHRYRFLRARAQAKYWRQQWLITWPEFLDLMQRMPGPVGRRMEDWNITRCDTKQGWSVNNVRYMQRKDATSRANCGVRRQRRNDT